MTTCSSILAWEAPRTEEPGGLQSTGSDTTEATQQQRRGRAGLGTRFSPCREGWRVTVLQGGQSHSKLPTTHILATQHTSQHPHQHRQHTHLYQHMHQHSNTHRCGSPTHLTIRHKPDTYTNTHTTHHYIHLSTHISTSMCQHTNMHSPKPLSHTNISAYPNAIPSCCYCY